MLTPNAFLAALMLINLTGKGAAAANMMRNRLDAHEAVLLFTVKFTDVTAILLMGVVVCK